MDKKHFIVTFENDKAQTTETLAWARKNFPNYNEQIKNEDVYLFLVDKNGFTLVSDEEKFVCFNFNEQRIRRQFITHRFYGGVNNYSIYFTIHNNEYQIIMNNSITLIINNTNIDIVKPRLRDIGEILGIDIIYTDAGRKRTTNELARKIFNFISDNFVLNNN